VNLHGIVTLVVANDIIVNIQADTKLDKN